jgi:hypothetical protein
MTKQVRKLFLAISVLAVPMTGAVAQAPAPAATGFQGATGAPTPGNKTPTNAAAAASKTTAPGAMGTRVVPGSNNMAVGGQPGMAETKPGGGTGSGNDRGSGR